MKTVTRCFLGLFIMTAFVLGILTISIGQENSKAVSDSAFICKNILDNMHEIQLSKLGAQKALDRQIKKAATQMVTDHTAILNELNKIAAKKNITGSKEANNINGKAEAGSFHEEMQDLENATGKAFDKLWLSHMMNMHNAKIAELEAVAGQLSDAELKSAVNTALPKLKLHKDMLIRIGYKFP